MDPIPSPAQGVGAPPSGAKRVRSFVLIGIVFLLTALLGIVLTNAAGRAKPNAAGRKPETTVGLARANLGDVPITVSALGTVTPEATVQIVPKVSGTLQSVAFREGQIVRTGQVLGVIDPAPYRAALEQAEGQAARDEATLAGARIDLARYQKLLAEDSIAKQTVDDQAASVRQAAGTVAADRGNVAAARLNLFYTRIVAPISGRVGLRQIDAGNQVSSTSSTPIAVITRIDPIDVVFAMPEATIADVTRHPDFGVNLPVTVYDRAGGRDLAHGSLSTIDNLVDTTTGTVKAKARFANPTAALFPNQFVNVGLLVDTLHNQVIVPTSAVRHGPSGDFVWVLQPGQYVRMRNVTLGPGASETVPILSGLRAGETVITEGGDQLSDCARVALPGRASPGGAGRHVRGHENGTRQPNACPALPVRA